MKNVDFAKGGVFKSCRLQESFFVRPDAPLAVEVKRISLDSERAIGYEYLYRVP